MRERERVRERGAAEEPIRFGDTFANVGTDGGPVSTRAFENILRIKELLESRGSADGTSRYDAVGSPSHLKEH